MSFLLSTGSLTTTASLGSPKFLAPPLGFDLKTTCKNLMVTDNADEIIRTLEMLNKLGVDPEYFEKLTGIQTAPGEISVPKGDFRKTWYMNAELEQLRRDPAPWLSDPKYKGPIFSLDEKGVLKFRITREMLEPYDPVKNPEGRGLWDAYENMRKIAEIAIAGVRDTINMLDLMDTRQTKNGFERYLTMASLALMVKILYNKGPDFPYQANYGHEVRPFSNELQEIATRTLAAYGFITHVVPDNKTTAIWNTSTMGKFFNLVLSFCGTASHDVSKSDGLKIMDYEGSQFLIKSIRSMVEIQGAILDYVKKKGDFEFFMSAADDPRITDQLYRNTNTGMDVYEHYQRAAILDKEVLDFVDQLDASHIYIDCMHGSAYRTLTDFFRQIKRQDLSKRLNWWHIDERTDFGNIGKSFYNPKDRRWETFDYGADTTQVYEQEMPDGTIKKYFPVLCTADYPERFAEMPIGEIILHTDMDHDRLVASQVLPNNKKTKEQLDRIGVVYNVINKEKIVAVFIPNKLFHFLHEINLDRLVKLMKAGKISKEREFVVLTTLASTPAVREWAEKSVARIKKEYSLDIKVKVIATAVGFSKLANVMYRTEDKMSRFPGKPVEISDASGKKVNIGTDPLLIAAWEESGGIITGITYEFTDLLGNKFLAQREKSATESIILSLALISKLQKRPKSTSEKRDSFVHLGEYLEELYIRDNIQTPMDIRWDNRLFIPGTSTQSKQKRIEADQRKNRIFGAHLSLVIAYMKGKIAIDEIRKILHDIFAQEYKARKASEHVGMKEAFLRRFHEVELDALVDIQFTGDGVMYWFEEGDKQWSVLFRPSGTEPKLKSYGFGSDSNRITVDAWAFAFCENIAGHLPESFTSNAALMDIWGTDGVKAVNKAQAMQDAWEVYGVVIDPNDPEDMKRLNLTPEKLEDMKLVRTFSPPDNHLELINKWLTERGLETVKVDLSRPKAMPQQSIVKLLRHLPDNIYEGLGRTKKEVIQKESAALLSTWETDSRKTVDDIRQSE